MRQLISRRSFLRTAALSSAALAVKTRLYAQPAKLPRKPNLLVFLPDQLRADTVAGPGASSVHAPNLHKLASQSVIFERAYVTQPICAPSRSSLLSGTWPHQNGCIDNKAVLSRKFRCLPEMLDDRDYRTGYFGKWHLGDEFSPQRGFEEWTSIQEYPKSALGDQKVGGLCDYSKFLISKGYKPNPHKGETFSRDFVSTLPFELSKPKFLETRACEFLQRHRDEPFVVFIAFFEPHPPYNGPFNSEHRLEDLSVEASVGDTFGEDIPLRYRLLQEIYKKRVKTAAKYRELKQKYVGLISEIDRSIGAILTKLDDLGLSDRTITVLTSDHGDMMSAHALLGKKVMFEQSARVPYLIRVPGQRPLSCAQPISHIDFAPTVLELMAKPSHPQCIGQSKANLVRGENPAPGLVFLEWARSPLKRVVKKQSKLATQEEMQRALFESTRAVVTPDGWKLCLRDKDKNELYNRRDDPEERHNLYYSATHRDIIAKLTDEIHKWQEGVQDTLKV